MLSWPAGYVGWILQEQTNALATNWTDLPDTAAVTSTNVPLVAENPAVFYRLRRP